MTLFRAALVPLLMLSCGASAQPVGAVKDQPPEKMTTLVVYGNDPCPRSSDEEIVVCARQPESDRYRVPKRFRGKAPGPESVTGSWANTVRDLEYVGRQGTPNSCSVIGSGGQTGCFARFLAQARAERAAARSEAAAIP
jgi:hypothetical protein